MPSLLKMIKVRSESHKAVDDDEIINPSMSLPEKRPSEQPRARPRSVKSTSQSAACRGLYATSIRRSTHRQRSETRSVHFEKSGRASVEPGGAEDDDSIIKCSMYPQMVGKRMSELRPRARTRSIKYHRASTVTRERGSATHTGRSAHRHERSSRMRSRSLESDLSYDSGYSSDENPEGRLVRVCMYPQAKYIKEPVKGPDNSSSEDASLQTNSSCTFKRSSLPSDEYQMLVRRQKMQRACEVLEPHFAHHGPQRGRCIWHGVKQGFTVRNSERRHMSKLKYAVRKALQANLDLKDKDHKLALCRHADKVYFCELSDVDGVPVEQKMIDEFTRLYQDAKDDAYVPKLTPLLYGEPVQRTWIDERVQRAAARLRADSGVAVKRPKLVSRFSWDSDSDDETGQRKHLMKTKR